MLEEDLGVQLFHRTAREVTLTAAGAVYFKRVEELFRGLDLATRELVSRFNRLLRLRIAPFFASEFLLPRLARLNARHPDVDLQVETSAASRASLDDANVSIVLGSGPWPAGNEAVRLFGQCYVAACAPSLVAERAIDDVTMLNRHVLLVHAARKDAWKQWADSGGVAAPAPRKQALFDTMTELVQAAERGPGIGLVPVPLAGARLRTGALTRLFDHELPSAESYFLLHRSEDATRAEISQFSEWLLEELQTVLEGGRTDGLVGRQSARA